MAMEGAQQVPSESPGGVPLYGVIMAGGTGTRFWPLSRRDCPKQFLAIGADSRSLIRSTFERLVPLAGSERIVVVANEKYRNLVFREIPELPAAHFLGEPAGRNTAPCIGLAARRVLWERPDAALVVCPADHAITPDAEFQRTVRIAVAQLARLSGADQPPTVTIGIAPHSPATGYGYIERGEPLLPDAGVEAYRVRRFHEKPDVKTASEYLESGRFYWNSGIFVWTARGVLDLIREYVPELAEGLETIGGAIPEGDRFPAVLREVFPRLPAQSIDYAVLERARHVAVVPASFEWDDVGSWSAAARYLPERERGVRVRGRHAGVRTENCVIVSGKRVIGTVGVRDLIVVETDDAVLVCHREAAEDVKKLVDLLEAEGLEELL